MRGAILPLPQYVFMAWCLVKHGHNFTFTFILPRGYCGSSDQSFKTTGLSAAGAPLMMSFPHFYNGEPSLFERIDGLRPNAVRHDGYLDIHEASVNWASYGEVHRRS